MNVDAHTFHGRFAILLRPFMRSSAEPCGGRIVLRPRPILRLTTHQQCKPMQSNAKQCKATQSNAKIRKAMQRYAEQCRVLRKLRNIGAFRWQFVGNSKQFARQTSNSRFSGDRGSGWREEGERWKGRGVRRVSKHRAIQVVGATLSRVVGAIRSRGFPTAPDGAGVVGPLTTPDRARAGWWGRSGGGC